MASLRWLGRRAADFGSGIVDTFLRDNRLLPPILALLALFVFAWVLAGVFIGRTDDQKPVAHRAEFAQADVGADSDPAAPEVDNPNVDSYAAYRSKDPFRQILPVNRTIPEGRTAAPPEHTKTPTRTRADRPAGGTERRRPADSDRDGLPDSFEAKFRGDPNNPDTDGDGIPDGLDDADGDRVPDGVEAAVEEGNRRDRAGTGGGAGGQQRRRDDLLDSGGTLSPP